MEVLVCSDNRKASSVSLYLIEPLAIAVPSTSVSEVMKRYYVERATYLVSTRTPMTLDLSVAMSKLTGEDGRVGGPQTSLASLSLYKYSLISSQAKFLGFL